MSVDKVVNRHSDELKKVDILITWKKWQVDKMVSRRNDKLTEWRVEEMTSWEYGELKNSGLTKWCVD